MTAVSSIFPTEECKHWAQSFPAQFRFSEYENVCENVLSGNAKAVIDISSTGAVRARMSETEDAQLWFIHNRSDECNVTVNEKGTFFVMTPSKNGVETIVSDGSFDIAMPQKSAVMLVREK